MPNGDYPDNRNIWQRVKDHYDQALLEHERYMKQKDTIEELEAKIEALTLALKTVQDE